MICKQSNSNTSGSGSGSSAATVNIWDAIKTKELMVFFALSACLYAFGLMMSRSVVCTSAAVWRCFGQLKDLLHYRNGCLALRDQQQQCHTFPSSSALVFVLTFLSEKQWKYMATTAIGLVFRYFCIYFAQIRSVLFPLAKHHWKKNFPNKIAKTFFWCCS